MRTERFMHKEAGVVLSQLLKHFDHDRQPVKEVVEARCRIIASEHFDRRVAACVAKGMEPSSEDRKERMINALVEIALVSFWHRYAFLSDMHYRFALGVGA
ncbi:hypothetical protein [Sinorhizobium meliloti]|uniref:hypothetical protein n=1 Tax=Rhizobium meliloti TaxID=382 RepID=UPI000FDB6BEE|nr:hypothetical protein [Sinorhizobium meliloti]RVP24588.1 hypothetical protein CN080_09990 [Sinorhizobium meliloti]RVP24666.1 hypothetical protein CN080_10410 [Sinorhizobium meliloti]